MNARRAPTLPRTFHGHGPARAADRHTHDDESDYPYEPFPEGDTTTPEACWDQHPENSAAARFYDPIVRWGDQQVLHLVGSQANPIDVQKRSNQLVQYQTRKPYGVRITLNATDLSASSPSSANYFVTWTVLIGCGSSQRTLQFVQQVEKPPQPLASDIVLEVGAEVVRVYGVAEFKAAYAPQVGQPTLMAQCFPLVHLPDDEIGPRTGDKRMVR
jgi:hypothetical protein